MQINLRGNEAPGRVSPNNETIAQAYSQLETADRVRRILADCGLSALQLEELTTARYGRGSPYVIAANFVSRLNKGVQPQIFQLLALSRLTDFCLDDWLGVFGIAVQHIPRLQMKLHSGRTIFVMPRGSLECTRVNDGPGGVERPDMSSAMPPPDTPLRYLYCRIGQEDGMAFPELMPGSIVRVDTSLREPPGSGSSRELFLVEHPGGLSCCHVGRITRDEVVLTPNYLPYPCLRYRLGEQAVILGTIDAELRPLRNIPIPEPSSSGRVERRYQATPSCPTTAQMLRIARERLGIRYREAQAITEQVAAELGNRGYAIALGSLSDYEASDALPRQIRKIISLCVAYALDLRTYLGAAGIDLQDQGRRQIPLRNLGKCEASLPLARSSGAESHNLVCAVPDALVRGFMQCMDLSDSLESIEYHAGTITGPNSPSALLVDRSSTTLESALWTAAWQRPVYLVRHRGGNYLHGFCTITDGLLTVHQSPMYSSAINCYPRGDVQVIGRVVAVLRQFRRS